MESRKVIKTLVRLQVVLTVFYSVLVYFLVGYQLQANKFFIFFVTCIIFQIITETLGTLAAIATSEATTAFLLVSCILWVGILKQINPSSKRFWQFCNNPCFIERYMSSDHS